MNLNSRSILFWGYDRSKRNWDAAYLLSFKWYKFVLQVDMKIWFGVRQSFFDVYRMYPGSIHYSNKDIRYTFSIRKKTYLCKMWLQRWSLSWIFSVEMQFSVRQELFFFTDLNAQTLEISKCIWNYFFLILFVYLSVKIEILS